MKAGLSVKDFYTMKERERIIKLFAKDSPIWESESLEKDIIALIKGESQKDNKTVSLLTEGEK